IAAVIAGDQARRQRDRLPRDLYESRQDVVAVCDEGGQPAGCDGGWGFVFRDADEDARPRPIEGIEIDEPAGRAEVQSVVLLNTGSRLDERGPHVVVVAAFLDMIVEISCERRLSAICGDRYFRLDCRAIAETQACDATAVRVDFFDLGTEPR